MLAGVHQAQQALDGLNQAVPGASRYRQRTAVGHEVRPLRPDFERPVVTSEIDKGDVQDVIDGRERDREAGEKGLYVWVDGLMFRTGEGSVGGVVGAYEVVV